MQVGFQSEVYIENESAGGVMICAVLTGEIEREVLLNLYQVQGIDEVGMYLEFFKFCNKV